MLRAMGRGLHLAAGRTNAPQCGIRTAAMCFASVPAPDVPTALCRSVRGVFNSASRDARHLLQQPRLQRSFSSGGASPPGATGGSGGSGGGGGDGSGGFGGLWSAYLGLLSSQPVLTKSVTAAVLNGVGDVLAQVWIDNKPLGQLDLKRLGKFTFLGLVMVGPALHFWYSTIARLVPAQTTAGALGRLFLDQVVFAPVFIAAFFSVLCTIEGERHLIRRKLKQDLKPAIITNWQIWVPFQFVNFRFIPLHLQVLASNVVAIAWNTYLSKASHNHVPEGLAG